MAYGKARNGRMSLAFLMKVDTNPATTVEVGKWYAIGGRDDTASVIPVGLEPGYYWHVETAPAGELGSGDVLYPITLSCMGEARDKSLDESKEVTEATCDKDLTANYVTDGVVSSSGTISCYFIEGSADTTIAEFRSRFVTLIDTTGDAVTVKNPTSAKDLIMINWDYRDHKAATTFEVDILPCIITSNNKSASYGSTDTLELGYTACNDDDLGHKKCCYKGTWTSDWDESELGL